MGINFTDKTHIENFKKKLLKMEISIVALAVLLIVPVTLSHANNFQRESIIEAKYGGRTGEVSTPYFVLFIFGGLAFGTLIRTVLKCLNIPLPYPVLMLLIGVIIGIISEYSSLVQAYTSVVEVPPRFLLHLIIPVLLFKIAFCIDAHTFMKAWAQIGIISVPIVLINAVFVGILMKLIIGRKWNYSMGMLFGTACTPIYPAETVAMLKEITQSKSIIILLEGESLVGVGSAIIIFEITMGFVDNVILTWFQFILVFLRFALGGLLFGLIMGKITCLIVSALYNDAVNVLSTTLVAAFVVYFLAEEVIFISGIISVVTLGVMISMVRTSLQAEVEIFLMHFWEMLEYISNTVIFLIFGVIIIQRLWIHPTVQDYALALVTYTLVNVGRLVAFLALAPILSRVGYGMTFRQLVVCVWGGLKGAISFCLTFIIYHHPNLDELQNDVLIHVSCLVCLSLIINACTMPTMLKVLGLSELSLARKANMNNCVRHVLARRERTVCIMKMERFLADANWPMVNAATVLKHPYKISINDSDDDDDFYLGYRYTTCPDCQKDIPSEPTTKELIEMTKEARLRILKAKKISYARQYENGMLSKEAIRILIQAVEIAMDTEEVLIDLEGLHKLFKRQGFVHYARRKLLQLFFRSNETDIKPPRKYWRRICYHIVMHPAFDFFIYACIVLNIVPIAFEIARNIANDRSSTSLWLKACNSLFYLIYVAEFFLKIFGYSWIYVCKHGFRTYFRSYWNIFDFCILIAASCDLILDFFDTFTTFNKAENRASTVTLVTKLIRVIRLVRIFRLCKASYPKLLKYCDSKIDYHMAFAYDVGKGFVTGEEEVSEMLIHMIDNKSIREDMRLRMEADRLAITKELGLIQKDRPWIAITVKTKQAIRATINSMLDAVNELKVSGWLDDVEYVKLMESLDDRLKHIRTIKSVQPSPPKVIFQEVPWMANDDAIIDFLYEHVSTKIFDPGDVIIGEGQRTEGIYIIVTGLFKVTYNPHKEILDRLAEYGELPVVDYISSPRFEDKIVDYIVSGNCVGELAVLTGRPYCSTVVADTPSQAYILSIDVMKQAMERSPDPTSGLEARIWKCISTKMATAILMDVPAYQSITQEKMKYRLEKAFMPNLTRYKVFGVNDLMEDIILIEGVAVDFNTRDCYTAPTYIPRTVQKLILPKSSNMNLETNIETKLLIIPTKDVEDYEIMEREEEISEMVSTISARCLQHAVQYRASKQRRRRKRAIFGITNRRVKYGTSYISTSSAYSRSLAPSDANSLGVDETEIQNINMSEKESKASIVSEKVKRGSVLHDAEMKLQREVRASQDKKRVSLPLSSNMPPKNLPGERTKRWSKSSETYKDNESTDTVSRSREK